MAQAEFSETQFVFGYLNELYRSSPFSPWHHFMFPSTVMERRLPVDFFVDHYSHSEYYQFKRSDYLGRRRGDADIAGGVPKSFLDYYRFKIYNRPSSKYDGQFDKLKELSQAFPSDLVCYCAPCFHSESEFHDLFSRGRIIENSIIIECNQFNQKRFNPPNFDINDGYDHYLIYKLGLGQGYICSEPIEINITNAEFRNETFGRRAQENNFRNTVFQLEELLDIQPPNETQNDFFSRITSVRDHLINYNNIYWQPIFSV